MSDKKQAWMKVHRVYNGRPIVSFEKKEAWDAVQNAYNIVSPTKNLKPASPPPIGTMSYKGMPQKEEIPGREEEGVKEVKAKSAPAPGEYANFTTEELKKWKKEVEKEMMKSGSLDEELYEMSFKGVRDEITRREAKKVVSSPAPAPAPKKAADLEKYEEKYEMQKFMSGLIQKLKDLPTYNTKSGGYMFPIGAVNEIEEELKRRRFYKEAEHIHKLIREVDTSDVGKKLTKTYLNKTYKPIIDYLKKLKL
jgi:hypothetical protein